MTVRSDALSILIAAAEQGTTLCTIVGIEGGFSRRVGAHLAVKADGSVIGSLSDGCLEEQLATEARAATVEGKPRLLRFGTGSPMIDFRLPCGSGLDIWVDPAPDWEACALAIRNLEERQPASLDLPLPADAETRLLRICRYTPPLRIFLFGEGPELSALASLAMTMDIETIITPKRGDDGGALSLGQAPDWLAADPWTAIVLLFHDHEWEQAILSWALSTSAFYIGAQGGHIAKERRLEGLRATGHGNADLARLRGPIGLIERAREPLILALSALAEIAAAYESVRVD
jgi:xanthine dehydrogenase accessory factor